MIELTGSGTWAAMAASLISADVREAEREDQIIVPDLVTAANIHEGATAGLLHAREGARFFVQGEGRFGRQRVGTGLAANADGGIRLVGPLHLSGRVCWDKDARRQRKHADRNLYA